MDIDTTLARLRRQARHPEGEEMTMEEVTEGMDPEEKADFEEMQDKHEDKFKKKKDKKALDLSLYVLRRLAGKEARHPEGVPMTMEEVTEDMSPEEAEEFEDQNDEHEDKFKKKDKGHQKEAGRPAGLYGYTKKVQRDCQGASNRLARYAKKIAKQAYMRDNRVAGFWATHGKRAGSNTARILRSALREQFKMARVEVKDVLDIYDDICLDDTRDRSQLIRDLAEAVAKKKGLNPSSSRDSSKVQKLKRDIDQKLKGRDECLDDTRVRRTIQTWVSRMASDEIGFENPDRLTELREMRKEAAYSMYGMPSSTVRLALATITDLKEKAGCIAYDLNKRRASCHNNITSFLKDHAKMGRCRYARLLYSCYPEQAARVAHTPQGVEEWLTWE